MADRIIGAWACVGRYDVRMISNAARYAFLHVGLRPSSEAMLFLMIRAVVKKAKVDVDNLRKT